MVSGRDSLLGLGIYTPSEAAHYARIRPQMMSRWIHGDQRGAAVVRAQGTPDEGERIVTFVDFIQSLAIRQFRRAQPAPSLQKIREAYDEAARRYNLEYPLARPHRCLYDGRDIWIRLPWREEDAEADHLFTKVTGSGRGQSMIREVAELYLDRVTFGGPDQLATRYVLYQDECGQVTMDPRRRFGEPLLPSGYTVDTIVDAYSDGNDVPTIAALYELDPNEVRLALRCDDFLAGVAG